MGNQTGVPAYCGNSTNSTGPCLEQEVPDMKWTEPACVGYLACILLANIAIHVCLHKRGRMMWEVVTWQAMGRGIGCCSALAMACYRLLFAAYVLYVDWVMLNLEPSDLTGAGADAVKADSPQANPASAGPGIFATFTVWSWTLVGVYFALAGAISLATACGCSPEGKWAHRFCCFTWALFEVMFACALLICVVVWGILLPISYMLFGSDGGLLAWYCLSAHNLNVVFMVVEASVNRLCFVKAHYVFVVYYGGLYVVFSWVWFYLHGFFFYFFIDWRHWFALVGYTVLLLALAFYFFVGRCLVNCVKYRSSTKLMIEKVTAWDAADSGDSGDSGASSSEDEAGFRGRR
mmetsp:Transcript_64076/g.167748  ORF Transcript_64076/g.167748 Transcript_64076/m.167748 type:complete len:348 (+) Transcript_64076:2-1045(+)